MAYGGGLLPTEDRAHYLKYISLLNDGGKLALLDKLKHSVPGHDILAHLQLNEPTISALHRRHVISDSQYNLLFPPSGQSDPSKFDITLLIFLLRSTCGLNARSTAWDPQIPPADSDISVEADCARLRNLRNQLIGHPEKTELSGQEFEDHWVSLEKILMRLGANISNFKLTIKKLKSKTIDPKREAELTKEVYDMLHKHDTMQQKQENMQQTQKDLLQEQKNMKQTQNVLTQEQENMKQTQKDLLQEQGSMKQAQKDLTQEHETMKQTQEDMLQKQETIKQKHKDVLQEQETMKQSQKALTQEQETMKQAQEDLTKEQDNLKQKQEDVLQEQEQAQKDLTKEQETIKQAQKDVLQKQETMKQTQDYLTKEQETMKQTQDDVLQDQETMKQKQKDLIKEQETIKQAQKNVLQEQETMTQIQKDVLQEQETMKQTQEDVLQEQETMKLAHKYVLHEQESMKQAQRDLTKEQETMKQTQEDVFQEQETMKHIQKDVLQEQETIKQTQENVLQEQKTIKQTQEDVLQEQETIKQTQENVLQEQKTIKQTQEDVLQEQETIKQTQENVLQEQKTIKQTQEDVLQEQKTIKQTHEDVLQEQETMKQSQKYVLQEQETMKQAQRDVLQEQKTMKQSQKYLLQEQETMKQTQGDVLQEQETMKQSQKYVLQEQKTIKQTQEDVLQEQETIKQTQENVLQEQKTIKQTQEDVLQEQKTIKQTHEDVLQEQETMKQSQKYVLQEQETMKQAQGDVLQEQKTMKQSQKYLLQEQETMKQTQGDVLQEQETMKQSQKYVLQEQETMKQTQGDVLQEQETMKQSQKYVLQEQETIKQTQGDVLQEQETMKQAQKDLTQEQETIKLKQDNMQQQLTTIEEKSTRSNTTIEDLQSTLLDLYKERFQRVPICLLKPTWKHPVRDMYVSQELKVVDHRGKPEHSENPEPSCPDTPSLDTIRDIFYNNGKKCKNIYITGEPAVGKSTFCEHLVELWCHAHSASNCQPTDLSEDLQSLSEFKLLFYINLREATIALEAPHSDEIAKLIFEQLDLSAQCSIDDIGKYLTDPSTLVVMDSLDELRSKRLPHRGLHNKSCIITTSRPWKLETCRSQLEGDVDKQIEIVGLARDSPKDLAENIIKILNKEFSQTKSSDQFIQKMQTDGLKQLLNIPILVIQMLSLWYDGESFGNSKYEIYSKMIHYQILAAVKAKELPEYAGKSKLDFPLSCNKDRCPCKCYGELLWKVAKLAYHTLFSENREVCLVFDHEETTVHGLSAEEVEICLNIGILTQHKLFVKKITTEKKSVSFLHKTNQEYFASNFLWSLASGRTSSIMNKLAFWRKKKSSPSKDQLSDPQHVFTAITDLDRALEMKEVILFYCQIDSGISRVLSRIISEKADDDRRVQEYRQSCDIYAPNTHLIENIQNIFLPANQQNQKLFLSDISITKPQWRRFIDDRYLDMAGVASIHVQHPVDGNTQQTLKKSKCLQKLVLSNSGMNVESIHEMVLENKDTLRTLGLYGGWDMSLDMSLGLYEEWPPLDISLGLYGEWRKPLDMSSLGRKLTEIFNGCQLGSLRLGNVKLSHTQCQILSRHFSRTDNLKQVTLHDIRCSTHEYSGECLSTLDLNNHKQMKKVLLLRLPVSKVRFMADQLLSCEIYLPDNMAAQTSALTCLRTARNLQQFECYNLRDSASVGELAVVLPQLNALQRIELYFIDFSCLKEIRLSAAMEKLEFVHLWRCTITDEGLKCLVDSLPTHKVMIRLSNVTIRGRENFLQKIRNSPNTEVITDYNVRYENGGWEVDFFVFYNNK